MISGTLFFLGYFRFDPSATAGPDFVGVGAAAAASGPSARATVDDDDDSGSTAIAIATPSGSNNHHWLFECQHNQNKYLCFPPYCAPGGIRSRIFPTSESELNKETSNPLFELFAHNPYLPAFLKEVIEEQRHDWNELGGSRCSFRRHQSSIVEKETKRSYPSSSTLECNTCQADHSEFNFKSRKGQEIFRAAQQSIAQATSRLSSLTAILAPEQSIHKQKEQSPKGPQANHHEISMTNRQRTPSPAVHVATTTATAIPTSNKLPSSAGNPIPQAVLVYHESAYSIVFRDHLRRQQKAIRQTSTLMEQSTHGGGGNESAGNRSSGTQIYKQQHPNKPRTPSTSRGPTYTITQESDMGYESTGSRGSTHSGGGESSSSVTSFRGGSSHPTRSNNNKMPISELQPVVVANFQPVIQPLEPLELNSSNVFEPLLTADPSNLDLTETEREVVELLRNEQAVVKTIRNADWTAFLQKFKPEEEGGCGTHEYHPSHRAQHVASGEDISDTNYPFNSFVTSTSLLPSCGMKMRKCFLV